MFEKFIQIEKGCDFYDSYFNWLHTKELIDKRFDWIRKKYGLETRSWLPERKYLKINPTANDLVKFQEDFSKTKYGSFMKKSEISKDWRAIIADIQFPKKPNIVHYLGLQYGVIETEVFHADDFLYAYICSEIDFELPDKLEQINKEKFAREKNYAEANKRN